MLQSLTPTGPGEGPHWERLAAWLRDRMPVGRIDGVWVFRVLRREQREFGTAVLSEVDGERRRIHTARYVATIKGKQRGGFEAHLEEVGSGPLDALHELLALVPVRAEDEDPPVSVDVALWFPPAPETDIDVEHADEIAAEADDDIDALDDDEMAVDDEEEVAALEAGDDAG